MLSRRLFLRGGVAVTALGTLSTCGSIPPRPLPPAQQGELLEDVLARGIGFLEDRDYSTARAHFQKYINHVLVSTDKGKSEHSIRFLYAISNIADAGMFDFNQIQTAGEQLTDLMYLLKDSSEHVEHMQDDLIPFFSLEDYPHYKRKCSKLRGRYQMFAFMLSLLEKDYSAAGKALEKAKSGLDQAELHDVNVTLQNLAEKAENEKRFTAEQNYEKLYRVLQ